MPTPPRLCTPTPSSTETSLLLRLIARRFGPPAPDLPGHIAALTSSQRGALSEALLDFGNATDVDRWLDNLAAER